MVVGMVVTAAGQFLLGLDAFVYIRFVKQLACCIHEIWQFAGGCRLSILV